MIFEHLNLKPRNPYLSLALEEAFSQYLANQGSTGFIGGIRLWVCPSSIILGRTCQATKNVKDTQLLKTFGQKYFFGNETIYLCRRLSGGGTVLHGSGSINYSVYLSMAHFPRFYNVKYTYQQILGVISKALKAQDIEVSQKGLSDLVMQKGESSLKVSGNSQFRKNGVIVLHGTLIIRPKIINEINLQLLHPPKEPEYRRGRDHAVFLGCLPDHFEIASFYQCFRNEISDLTQVNLPKTILPSDLEKIYSTARKLSRQVYTKPDWVLKADGKCGRERVNKSEVMQV